MSADALKNIAQIEDSLWQAADQLRANSKLTSSEYCMPVLGVIFLRHATNRYQAALQAIEADQAAGKMPKRQLVKGDFIKRRALMLPEVARYDYLLKLPSGAPGVTRAQVKRAKPDPGVFLAAAEQPHVPIARCIVVGDSVWDLLAARRASALGVGLLSGGYGREELERAGAYRTYHDPADLLRHVDECGVRLG